MLNDVLAKLFDYLFGTWVPWWETVLTIFSIILLIIGISTDNYAPGTENNILVCQQVSNGNCNSHNNYEKKIDVNASSETVSGSRISVQLRMATFFDDEPGPYELTQCVNQLLWRERNFGHIVFIFAVLFVFILLVGRLHPEVRGVISNWSFVFTNLESITMETISKSKKACKKRTKEIQTADKISDIVHSSQNKPYDWSVACLVNYPTKWCITLCFAVALWCFANQISASHSCQVDKLTFHCILKLSETYHDTAKLFVFIFILSSLAMMFAQTKLHGETFGSESYMKILFSNQKHLSKKQEQKYNSIAS